MQHLPVLCWLLNIDYYDISYALRFAVTLSVCHENQHFIQQSKLSTNITNKKAPGIIIIIIFDVVVCLR